MEIDIKKSLNLINFFLIHYKCYNSIKFIIGTNLSYVGNIKLSFCNKFYTQNVTVLNLLSLFIIKMVASLHIADIFTIIVYFLVVIGFGIWVYILYYSLFILFI